MYNIPQCLDPFIYSWTLLFPPNHYYTKAAMYIGAHKSICAFDIKFLLVLIIIVLSTMKRHSQDSMYEVIDSMS